MQRLSEVGAKAIVPVGILLTVAIGLSCYWVSNKQAAVSPQAKFQQDVVAAVQKAGGKVTYGIGNRASLLESAGPPPVDSVNLADKGADGALLEQLCQLTTIQRLNLEGTKIQGGGFGPLNQLVNVESLALTRTQIVDSDVSALAKLPKLKTLSLRETAVSDAGLKQLAGLPGLQNLNLWQTKVTADGMATVSSFPLLQTVSLDEECITPESVRQLKSITSLQAVEIRVASGFGKNTRELLMGQLSAIVTGFGKDGQQIWDGLTPWDETVAGAVEMVTTKFAVEPPQHERLMAAMVGTNFNRVRPNSYRAWSYPPDPPPQVINTLDEFVQALQTLSSSKPRTKDIQVYVRDRFSKEDIPKLVKMLQSPENAGGNLRWYGQFLLVHFGLDDPSAVRELDRMFSHEDPSIRTRACLAFRTRELALAYDTDWIASDKIAEFAVPRLVRLCGDDSLGVRNNASTTLADVAMEHPQYARQVMPALLTAIRLGVTDSLQDAFSRLALHDKEAAIAAVPELLRMLENAASEVPSFYFSPGYSGQPLTRERAISAHTQVIIATMLSVSRADPDLTKEVVAQILKRMGDRGMEQLLGVVDLLSLQNGNETRTMIGGLLDLAESDDRQAARSARLRLAGIVLAVRDAIPDFTLQLDVVKQELNPDFCWFHPRVAAVPGKGKEGKPLVVLTLQKHLAADDHYSGLHYMTSGDLGATWSEIKAPKELDWKPGENNETIAVCDVTPGWHPQTKKVIAIGTMLRYSQTGAQLMDKPRSYDFAYAVYDPQADAWTAWQRFDMPTGAENQFCQVAPGCVQWLVKPDGKLLVPIYFQGPNEGPYAVTVVQAAFDGSTLKYVSNGNELYLNDVRGLVEPSIASFNYEYYLTVRNDNRSYVTQSYDGIYFRPLKPWKFDDGSELGSYNTQQHWVVHNNGLFLVYTRRGANNDHITRHRAPLFMARVSPGNLHVIRATEKELIPERGVMLGNFGAAFVNKDEWWVTDSEFITGGKAHPRGANGSTFAARIKWSKPSY